GPKLFLIETISKRWAGFRMDRLPIPGWIHPMLGLLKRLRENKAIDREPLVPQVMPVQIFTIGPLAIVALPAEPTTMTGRRMKKTLEPILARKGIRHILITGYANAYSGYITTYEEYHAQCYEGAHTLFGKWTGAAYQMILKHMALEMLKEPAARAPSPEPRPPRVRIEDLVVQKFSFYRWKLRTYARTRRRLRSSLGRSSSRRPPSVSG